MNEQLQDKISIRKAEMADIEVVKAIEIESGLSNWSIVDYQFELGRADSLFLIAEVNSDPAGFILARLIMNQTTSLFENEAEIYNIAITKEFRNKGIGTNLLNKLFEKAMENKVSKIYLEVRKSNTGALIFYQKNGFEIIGERRNFYTNPTEDALLMTRISHD